MYFVHMPKSRVSPHDFFYIFFHSSDLPLKRFFSRSYSPSFSRATFYRVLNDFLRKRSWGYFSSPPPHSHEIAREIRNVILKKRSHLILLQLLVEAHFHHFISHHRTFPNIPRALPVSERSSRFFSHPHPFIIQMTQLFRNPSQHWTALQRLKKYGLPGLLRIPSITKFLRTRRHELAIRKILTNNIHTPLPLIRNQLLADHRLKLSISRISQLKSSVLSRPS